MPKRSSPMSLETESRDGIYKMTSIAVTPISGVLNESDAGSDDKSDSSSTTSTTTASGVARLLGRSEQAPVSDGAAPDLDLGEDYPEGEIRGWLVVLGCWLGLFASLGFMQILATSQAYLTTTPSIHVGPHALGGAIFGYASLSLLLGVYVGPLFDSYGPRWLILGGTACLVASLLLVSVSTAYWHLFAALGILSSLGSSLLFTPSIAAIAHFFQNRRGFATGVAATAGPASGVIFPFIVQSLFVKVGWAWAMRALALICLAITIAASFLIRSRLPPAKDATPHPHRQMFRTTGFTPTVVAVVLAQFASFLPLTYLSSYALGRGFSQAFSFKVIAILNASSVVGRVLGGWWADRIGPFNANMVFCVIAAFVCFVIWLPAGGTKPGIAIFAVVFGCASGSSVSLVPVLVGRLCKTQDYGRYYGACYTIASLVSLFAIPVAGRVVRGNGGSYWGLIVTTGLLYIAAAVAFAVAKMSVLGRRIWVGLGWR
ncbi:major facilitator superfamily domain-containing protein [Achaetomium macrosporum]|uniref:Major facilitator superfamily domain-containing protein n=1 Tax=Achaetomium macrosporum TaxID=79813 RepID=A0AAN7HD19_9PEZI|nr:major facilitator superfamily domain-containing protein [Achaetomium macrosporum]